MKAFNTIDCDLFIHIGLNFAHDSISLVPLKENEQGRGTIDIWRDYTINILCSEFIFESSYNFTDKSKYEDFSGLQAHHDEHKHWAVVFEDFANIKYDW